MGQIRFCLITLGLLLSVPAALAADNSPTTPDELADCAGIFNPVGMPSGKDGADEHEFVFANGLTPEPLPGSTAKREVPTFLYKCYKKGFAVRLNAVTKVPDWVAEDVTLEESQGPAGRSNHFFEDIDLPEGFSSHLSDYRGSGLDRGHQAPAGDFSGDQELKNETFVLSNMGPQVGACFNRGIWKDLETALRDLVKTRGRLIIFTGPIYGDRLKTIGDTVKSKKNANVAVPDAFFKIVYSPRDNRTMAVEISNQAHCDQSYQDPEFLTSVKDIEEKTGFTFFPMLSAREHKLLTMQKSAAWTW